MALYSIIEQSYGIERIRSVVKQDSGDLRFSCTDGEEYVFKEKNDAGALGDEYRLHVKVRRAGIPVEALVRTVDDHLFVEFKESRFALYSVVNGLSPDIVQGEENASCLVACGEAVGRLHRALEDAVFDTIPEVYPADDLAGPGRDQLGKVFADRKLLELTDVITSFFSSSGSGLPRQPVIGTPAFKHILMDGEGNAGFINLEKVVIGYRLWDICCLAGEVLYDLVDKNLDLEVWPSRLRGLFTGYQREVHLTETERSSVPFMLYLVQLAGAVRCLREQRRKYAIRHIDMLKYIVKVSKQLDLPGRTGDA